MARILISERTPGRRILSLERGNGVLPVPWKPKHILGAAAGP
jgi:hypothetical protein